MNHAKAAMEILLKHALRASLIRVGIFSQLAQTASDQTDSVSRIYADALTGGSNNAAAVQAWFLLLARNGLPKLLEAKEAAQKRLSGVIRPPVGSQSVTTPLPPPSVQLRRLSIASGVSVRGHVQDADQLVIKGVLEASNIRAIELFIAEGGIFRGEVEVKTAEVTGTFDGVLVAHDVVVVRAGAMIIGAVRCRRLQIDAGGLVSGRIEMLAVRLDDISSLEQPSYRPPTVDTLVVSEAEEQYHPFLKA